MLFRVDVLVTNVPFAIGQLFQASSQDWFALADSRPELDVVPIPVGASLGELGAETSMTDLARMLGQSKLQKQTIEARSVKESSVCRLDQEAVSPSELLTG